MKDVKISTAATWESITNLFGSFTTPLLLNIKIVNDDNSAIKVKNICISIKNFFGSIDILSGNKNELINPNSYFEYKIDVKYILEKYSASKKFTVKVTFDNNEVFESNKITVNMLTDAKLRYS